MASGAYLTTPSATSSRSIEAPLRPLVARLSTVSRLGEPGSLWDLVWRQTRGCFQSPAEVEEGDQRRDLPDCTLAPADVPQRPDVVLVHEARRLRELAGVTEQRSSLGVQLVFGPRRREFVIQMLIAREAANCRRVEPQSGGATHLAVDDRRDHLALESAERRAPAEVKVAI